MMMLYNKNEQCKFVHDYHIRTRMQKYQIIMVESTEFRLMLKYNIFSTKEI